MRLGLWVVFAMALSGPAEAAVSNIAHAGGWDAFGGVADDGNQVCGVSTGWADGRAFLIKVFGAEQGFSVQLVKSTWSIPQGTQMPVVISFGGFPPWSITATGHQNIIQLQVAPSEAYAFARQFVTSSAFAVSFPAGSEPTWAGSLSGSGTVGNAMAACINMLPGHAPTQPYSTQPQAPAQPSQPFQQQSSPAPSTPSAPTASDGFDHV